MHDDCTMEIIRNKQTTFFTHSVSPVSKSKNGKRTRNEEV